METAVILSLLGLVIAFMFYSAHLENEVKKLKGHSTITIDTQTPACGLVVASWKDKNITYQVVRYVERV
ncbi:MAG: hypothetical protein WC356_05045 [Candidatus Micrarchaeia archaeon]